MLGNVLFGKSKVHRVHKCFKWKWKSSLEYDYFMLHIAVHPLTRNEIGVGKWMELYHAMFIKWLIM